MTITASTIFSICITIFLLISFTVSPAVSFNQPWQELRNSSLPEQYGKVVYTREGTGSKHVYIILQAHRSSVSGLNNRVTIQAQSDIYRIEEWLVRHKNVQLLLPEGFFRNNPKAKKTSADQASLSGNEIRLKFMDDETLRRELSDSTEFVNADRLLCQYSNIRLRQIEDRELYFEVHNYLSNLKNEPPDETPSVGAHLFYLQGRRNAHLLQKLPEIIEGEYRTGRISSAKAIFTIGLAHGPEIIRILDREQIAANFIGEDNSRKEGPLKLAESGYHVTVIIPAALLNKLDYLAESIPTAGDA